MGGLWQEVFSIAALFMAAGKVLDEEGRSDVLCQGIFFSFRDTVLHGAIL